MSCQTILDVLSDKPVTSAEIEAITNYKRSYISAFRIVTGKVTKVKVESTNKLGPRMIYVFSLAPTDQ